MNNFTWTDEQDLIFAKAANPMIPFLKVEAVAGASKTTILVEIANRLPSTTKHLYMTFSKAMTVEASAKFPTNTKCQTIHSLAYVNVVRQRGLRVGWFGPRDVSSDYSYPTRKKIVDILEDFLLSPYLDPSEYLTSNKVDAYTGEAVIDILDAMSNAEIPCTHSFYLKMFHVLLANGDIEIPEVDLLMIDEAGDLSELTISVFKLLKAKKKIMVGDPHQSIMKFMHCTNAFTYFKDEGEQTTLTRSFRVSNIISERVQGFMRSNVAKDFVFQGMVYDNSDIKSSMYIARNNTGLLAEMFTLKQDNVPFTTTRDIGLILELPLVLANLDNGQPVKEFRYKALENFRKAWHKSPMTQHKYSTVKAYVTHMMKDDDEITAGLKVVERHGSADIKALADYVNSFKGTTQSLVLSTAHSSKGLEADSVTFAPDVDQGLTKAISEAKLATGNKKIRLVAECETEYLLYYVACTRARKELIGANLLPRGSIR